MLAGPAPVFFDGTLPLLLAPVRSRHFSRRVAPAGCGTHGQRPHHRNGLLGNGESKTPVRSTRVIAVRRWVRAGGILSMLRAPQERRMVRMHGRVVRDAPVRGSGRGDCKVRAPLHAARNMQ